MNLSFFAVFMVCVQAFALNPQVKLLVDMETKSNGAALRDNQAMAIDHYEIPLSLITEDREFNLDPKILNSLVFEKNGIKMVRWVVNPEDTKWHKDVEAFMVKNGLEPIRHQYFIGYQTASRSYIVEDPKTKFQFSIKTSTDKTGGAWKDKKQEFKDGFDIRMISNLVARVQARSAFKYLVVMMEPYTVGIKAVDQSIVIRELGTLNKSGEFYYVPGFSVLHESAGKMIAEKNGSNDPYEFWTENYIKPAARAAAEFSLKTGLWFDSPHSQNFLVELDKNMKPTGRIVLRDLGDVYLAKPVLKALGEVEIARKFSEQHNIKDFSSMAFGPLHGNTAPSWVTQAQYDNWGKVYADQVVDTTSEITKISREIIAGEMGYGKPNGFSYITSSLSLDSPVMKNYLSAMPKAPKLCIRVHAAM